MRYWLLILALVLTSCINRPKLSRPAATPPRVPDQQALRQCIGRLDHIVARYALLADRDFGGGCSALGAVQLRDIGTPVTNLGAMTCALGYAFTSWVQNDLAMAAMTEFGSPVVRVETFGTYSCRNVNGGTTGLLSEHAFANAVDVSALVLKDGRRITIADGWRGDEHEQRFLRTVRDAACRRFNTVLSPDYNAQHRDHLHFDMGRGPFCR